MAQDEVRSSFERCAIAGSFAEQFYGVFLKSSPEMPPLFAKTDFVKQRKLLRATVYIMITRKVNDPKARETLERIGRSHGRSQLNIRPKLYELWLDSVRKAVKHMDPEWSSELDRKWCNQLRTGIDVITSLY